MSHPRERWEVGAVDFNHGEIGQRIGADQFGFHNFAVAHGDANVDCAIDDVVVGDDVSVGRNDYAAADAVLDLRLGAAVWAEA